MHIKRRLPSKWAELVASGAGRAHRLTRAVADIINRGRIVASESVSDLTSKMKSGADTVSLEVHAAQLNAADVRQRFEQIPGVSRVEVKDVKDSHSERRSVIVEVESLIGSSVRPELARAVVQAGWNLQEMRGISMSLEDIFLQLTGASPSPALESPAVETPAEGNKQ